MSEEARLRELMCLLAKSLFDRGLTGGSTGNISARALRSIKWQPGARAAATPFAMVGFRLESPRKFARGRFRRDCELGR